MSASPADSREIDDLERLLIERACGRLVTSFSHHVDHGQAARIADLFAEDGEFTAPGVVTLRGRDELREGLGRRQEKSLRAARHVCSNLLIDVLGRDHAEGVVYVAIYRHEFGEGEDPTGPAPLGPPLMLGEYRDRFVPTDRGWRFARREVRVAFRSRR